MPVATGELLATVVCPFVIAVVVVGVVVIVVPVVLRLAMPVVNVDDECDELIVVFTVSAAVLSAVVAN